MKIPTTDEMDSTTPEERKKLVGMCAADGTWNNYQSDEGFLCTCGGKSVVTSSVHSQRTFNVDRAKKETAKYLKGKKK